MNRLCFVLRAVAVPLAAAIALPGCPTIDSKPVTLTSSGSPIERLLREHADLRQRLDDGEKQLALLAAMTDRAEQRTIMQRLVVFFTVHVDDHARWEERDLYPVADKQVGGTAPFTASLREEHAVMKRWIADLTRISNADYPDTADFARRAYELVGLVRAHLEAEDRTLLPFIDPLMSWEEFDRAMKARAVPHDPPPPR